MLAVPTANPRQRTEAPVGGFLWVNPNTPLGNLPTPLPKPCAYLRIVQCKCLRIMPFLFSLFVWGNKREAANLDLSVFV